MCISDLYRLSCSWLQSRSVLHLDKFRKVQQSAKKIQFYKLHWSKFQTILKNQYEHAKAPVAFTFLA